MAINFFDLNWLGIIIASIVYFIFGGLWFSPVTPKMSNPKLYGLITGLYHTIGFVMISIIICLI